MRRTIILQFPLILSLLLTACDWRGFNIPNRYEHMRQELAALQAMNQADSILTDDSQSEVHLLKEQIQDNESIINDYHDKQQLFSLFNEKMCIIEAQNNTLAERLAEKEKALQKAKDKLNSTPQVKAL